MQCSIYEQFQEVEHHGLDLEMESISASDYNKKNDFKIKIPQHEQFKNCKSLKCYEHFKVCNIFSINHQEIPKLSRCSKLA